MSFNGSIAEPVYAWLAKAFVTSASKPASAREVFLAKVVVPIFVPAATATSALVTVALTTLNDVENSPTIFVSLGFVTFRVTLPVPTVLLSLVTIVTPAGITLLYARTAPVDLSVKVISSASTFTLVFLSLTFTVYFSPNLLKSRALTV